MTRQSSCGRFNIIGVDYCAEKSARLNKIFSLPSAFIRVHPRRIGFFPLFCWISDQLLVYNFRAFLLRCRSQGWHSPIQRGKESFMFTSNNPLRIAVYGSEIKQKGRGVGLWATGYHGTLVAAGAEPVFLEPNHGGESWDDLLDDVYGVVACGYEHHTPGKLGDIESLCLWCRSHRFPLLTIDNALLAMNSAFGGLNYTDLPRELPEALQHRHPPEHGLRHAINVTPGTLMCKIYGEGEIVVNSEHRQAIQRVAKGFAATAVALDNVIEAVEHENENWFCVGVQWQPASPSASGLDIQVFRALIDAAQARVSAPQTSGRKMAMAG
jgi:putative glutamine amidotransferase